MAVSKSLHAHGMHEMLVDVLTLISDSVIEIHSIITTERA
jgi:hypothetical protein